MPYSNPYCRPEECSVVHKSGDNCVICCPCDICGEQRYWNESYVRLERQRLSIAMTCEDY